MRDAVVQVLKKEPHHRRRNAAIVLTLVVLVALGLPYIQYNGISVNGLPIAKSILKAFVNPNYTLLFSLTSKDGVPYMLLETVAIGFLGTLIGMILSVPISFLASRNMFPRWFCSIWILIITIIRTFPAFVYGLMFIRVTGPGAFTGVLTLAITSVGMISKLFIEVIEELDRGIIEALDSMGCSTLQKIRYGIIPQLMGNFLSITIYRFEINIKNASILGLVGAGGIGASLMFAIGASRWKDVGSMIWGLVIMVLIVEFISGKIRQKLAMSES